MNNNRIRMMVVTGLFSMAFLLVIYQLFSLQVVQRAQYREDALNNRLKSVSVEARRGDIVDRNGEVLAASTAGESVAVFPAEIRAGKFDAGEMAERLGEILEMEPDLVLEKLTADSNFVWLKRKIPFRAGPEIRELKFPGVVLFEESQRYYPKGHLASQTIGFAGLDNQGLAGLEVTYDDILSGEPGQIRIEIDSRARTIPESVHNYEPPVQGSTLVLTLDARLQYRVEKYAEELLLETGAERITILVMDPRNGEILAMTGKPDFDAASYGSFPQDTWQNPAIQKVYEPGSTFKIITAGALLEQGTVRPESQFYDKGYIHVGGIRIRCWRSHDPHGQQTFTEALGNSCNPVFVEAALKQQKAAPGTLFDFYRTLGMGSRTPLKFTGQASGIMPESEQNIYVATSSIGQGIAVSPVQLAAAVSSLVNGGLKVDPVLVREIRDGNGLVTGGENGVTGQRVVSEQTSREIREMLEAAVVKGTAKNGAVKGFRVGGKTGTAQKPSETGGYLKDKFITSFLSVAPIEDPEIVTLVIVDAPDVEDASGGGTAGPTASRVMEEALSLRGLSPDYQVLFEEDSPEDPESREAPADVRVPDFIGMHLDAVAARLSELGLGLRLEGTGDLVVNQDPRKDIRVPRGTTVTLTMEEAPAGHEQVVVPDVTGTRVVEAARILESAGLVISVNGSGLVTGQFPEAGTFAPKGSQVQVTCSTETGGNP